MESFKQSVKLVAGQADLMSRLPRIDLTEPVAHYFEYVQQAVDLNRDLATRWADWSPP